MGAFALAVAGLAVSAAPARAEDPTKVPLTTHSVPAALMGLVDGVLVTASDEGGTHVRAPGGGWDTTDLDRSLRPADVTYLDHGTLVALAGDTVEVLDTANNLVNPVEVGEGLWTANATTAVRVAGWENGNVEAWGVDLATWDARALDWPLNGGLPTGALEDTSGLGQGWISHDAWVAPMIYLTAANKLVATDLDVIPLVEGLDAYSVRLTGATVLWADQTAGQPLRYVALAGTTLRSCTVATATATPSCVTMKTKVKTRPSVHAFGGVLGLTIGSTSYLWQAGKLVTVTGIPRGTTAAFTGGGVGDATLRPMLAARGSKPGFYTVSTKGKATRTVTAVVEAVTERSLDLGAGWLVGTDNAGSERAWMRSLADGTIGTEKVLTTKGRQVRTSGDRVAVNGKDGLWFYRGGTRTATFKAVPALLSLSGPYALIREKNGTATLRTESRVVATGIIGAIAQFGSYVAQLDEAAGTVTVRDWAGGTGVPVGDPRPFEPAYGDLVAAGLWGDWLMLGYEDYDLDTDTTTPRVVVSSVLQPDVSYGPRNYYAPVLGDNVVAAVDETGHGVVWDFRFGGTSPSFAPIGGPAISSSGFLSYTTEYDELWVTSLGGSAGGLGQARALAVSAGPASGAASFRAYDGWRVPWKVSVEATKALDAGTLRIRLNGTVIAERPTVASATGTITGTWDGIDDTQGRPADTSAPDLAYTWELDVDATDQTGPLTSISGDAIGGDLTVENDTMPYPLATPKITDTTPVVGQELGIVAVPHAPDAVFGYTWRRGSTVVGHDATYVVTPADLGKKLSVRVVAIGDIYTEVVKTSASTSAVGKGTFTPATVAFSRETPVAGVPVTASGTGWVPSPATPAYTWYRLGPRNTSTKVGTGDTYTPKVSDIGHLLKVVVTAKAPGYKDRSVSGVTANPVSIG
ncbi:MAG: hypothetical protein LCH87_15335 [Actinobacteria bacterium]|nr:hypothetical protein [Actinomycetota bacterium]